MEIGIEVLGMSNATTWKKIPGWNYSVSSDGDVRNDGTGYILKPLIARNGYARVGLWLKNKCTYISIHRLVYI